MQADITDCDLYLFLGGTSSATSISTSMHDAGSAAASYTILNAASSVETTTEVSADSGGNSSALYEQTNYDQSSSGGSSTRPSGSRGGGGANASGLGVASAKGGMPASPQPSPIMFSVIAGYQSDYVYHGASQIDNAIKGPNDGVGMYFAGVAAEYKGLNIGLKYIRSDVSNLNPRFDPNPTASESYSEFVFDANYTLGLIGGSQDSDNWLDATLGYQLLSFQEETFWNTDAQHKFYAQLKANRYQWVRPSLSYYHFTQGDALTSGTSAVGFKLLEGDQIIFQIDGGGQIYDNGTVQLGVAYYVQSGWDDQYNTAATWQQDWYQGGVTLPITYGDWSVVPNVHYTDSDAPKPGFWWGINTKYTF